MLMRMMLVAAFAALFAAPASASVYGVWKSEPNDKGTYVHVKLGPCGGAVCGTIVKLVNGEPKHKNQRRRKIIWGMTPDGPNSWSGGKIWAPDDDATYASKMQLKGNVLKVSGCVLGGLICRSQTLNRI